jgi:hypothetical protein
VGQRREQAKWRNDADKKKRQNSQPSPGISGMAVRDQKQDKGCDDCDSRNQSPSPPMLISIHCRATLGCEYSSRENGRG